MICCMYVKPISFILWDMLLYRFIAIGTLDAKIIFHVYKVVMSSFESRNGYNNGMSFPSSGGLHVNPNNNNRPVAKPRSVSAPYPMYHGHVAPQPVVRSVMPSAPQPLGTSLINRSASTAPTASLLVDRRVEHMEENVKRLKDLVESLAATLKERKYENEVDASVSSWMSATVTHTTKEYITLDEDIAAVVARVSPSVVNEGTKLSVAYPMHKVLVDDNIAIVMRRRMVDSETAQISGSWVVVNVPSAEQSTLVSDFSF